MRLALGVSLLFSYILSVGFSLPLSSAALPSSLSYSHEHDHEHIHSHFEDALDLVAQPHSEKEHDHSHHHEIPVQSQFGHIIEADLSNMKAHCLSQAELIPWSSLKAPNPLPLGLFRPPIV